jgi:DNA-binding protein H-NS
MKNYIELKSQIEKLQKEAEVLRKRERAKTIANIKVAIRAFELTGQDLGLVDNSRKGYATVEKSTVDAKHSRSQVRKVAVAGKASRKVRKKSIQKLFRADKRSIVAPKYRDSSTGTTWTGRGKQPRWLSEALNAGRSLEDFKV